MTITDILRKGGSNGADANYPRTVSVPAATGVEATDTANIQAAIALAETGAGHLLAFPDTGDYHVNATIVISNCDVMCGSGVRIISSASGSTVQLGSATVNLTSRTVHLPQILRRSDMYGSGVGVELKWVNGVRLHMPHIYRFDNSILLKGDGLHGGYVYGVTLFIGLVVADRVNLIFDAMNSGFTTQCTFAGGIFTFGVSGTRVAGTRQIILGTTSTQDLVGQHIFMGCDLESDIAEYHVDCYESGNHWYNCRWETQSGNPPRIRFLDDGVGTYFAHDNTIQGGWQSETLELHHSTYTKRNIVALPGGKTAIAQRTSGAITLNSTTVADVDTSLDLTINQVSPGEVVEVSINGRTASEAVYGFIDCATIVSGSPVNYIGNPTGFSAGVGQWGVPGWMLSSGAEQSVGTTVRYVVKQGDLTNGTLKLRLRYYTSSAANKTLYAGSGNPFTFSAVIVR